jgi:hypothetical protein
LTVLLTTDRYLLFLLAMVAIPIAVSVLGFWVGPVILCPIGILLTLLTAYLGPRLAANAVRDITGKPSPGRAQLPYFPRWLRRALQRVFAPQYFG